MKKQTILIVNPKHLHCKPKPYIFCAPCFFLSFSSHHTLNISFLLSNCWPCFWFTPHLFLKFLFYFFKRFLFSPHLFSALVTCLEWTNLKTGFWTTNPWLIQPGRSRERHPRGSAGAAAPASSVPCLFPPAGTCPTVPEGTSLWWVSSCVLTAHWQTLPSVPHSGAAALSRGG